MNNNLTNELPDLMRRATENLEPESTDLVERGMRRGVTLRRRRTALLSLSGAGAVLATAGIVMGGNQVFSNAADEAPTAGTPTQTAPSTIAKPVTPQDTLATLNKLVPTKLKVSRPETWGGDGSGFNGASVLVDDGLGASQLSVLVQMVPKQNDCAGTQPRSCTVQADGTVLVSDTDKPLYREGANPGGIRETIVEVFRPNGTLISIRSLNGPAEKGVEHTRVKPALTVAELTTIAHSKLWAFPPKPTSNPNQADPKSPGAGKPAVPVGQTLATLKLVLPRNLQLTRPETWGGGTNGFNGASQVVDDGKGLSRVDVLVTIDLPKRECGEGLQNCEVRSDGSVLSWSKNEPVYPPGRNTDGVVSNRIELTYKDGRSINMSSYNGPQEKGAKHTRPKPAFTTDQLIAMAENKAWKFPGTGTK